LLERKTKPNLKMNTLKKYKANVTKTRQQIAFEYEISTKTLSRWLKREKIAIPSGLVRPIHLELIYRTFGWPK